MNRTSTACPCVVTSLSSMKHTLHQVADHRARAGCRKLDSGRPEQYNVLFLCTGNSARSIMAECLLERIGSPRFRAFSAGELPRSGAVNPYALDILERRNHATGHLRSKDWNELGRPRARRRWISCSPSADPRGRRGLSSMAGSADMCPLGVRRSWRSRRQGGRSCGLRSQTSIAKLPRGSRSSPACRSSPSIALALKRRARRDRRVAFDCRIARSDRPAGPLSTPLPPAPCITQRDGCG